MLRRQLSIGQLLLISSMNTSRWFCTISNMINCFHKGFCQSSAQVLFLSVCYAMIFTDTFPLMPIILRLFIIVICIYEWIAEIIRMTWFHCVNISRSPIIAYFYNIDQWEIYSGDSGNNCVSGWWWWCILWSSIEVFGWMTLLAIMVVGENTMQDTIPSGAYHARYFPRNWL